MFERMSECVTETRPVRTCTIEGCDLEYEAKGLCRGHYSRLKRGMDLMNPPLRPHPLRADLRTRLRTYAPEGAPDECWEWTRSLSGGYGVISVGGGRIRNAHVIAWELDNGQSAPKGMLIRHTCDNPPCTNPAHLLLGTYADNAADKVARNRQDKGEGHPKAVLTEEQVHEIRALANTGITQQCLAERFGVKQPSISSIILRKVWRHI